MRFLRELSWEILPPAPPGGHVYEYQVKPKESAAGDIIRMSSDANLSVYYRDGTYGQVELENPKVCVHPAGRPEWCDDFIATLTPPAPTDTATPTSTATEPGPTATLTVTATSEPDSWPVYLPVTVRGAVFQGR
jgi:hypothetical protein